MRLANALFGLYSNVIVHIIVCIIVVGGKDNKNVAYNQHFLLKMLPVSNTFYEIMLPGRNTFATPLQCYS